MKLQINEKDIALVIKGNLIKDSFGLIYKIQEMQRLYRQLFKDLVITHDKFTLIDRDLTIAMRSVTQLRDDMSKLDDMIQTEEEIEDAVARLGETMRKEPFTIELEE